MLLLSIILLFNWTFSYYFTLQLMLSVVYVYLFCYIYYRLTPFKLNTFLLIYSPVDVKCKIYVCFTIYLHSVTDSYCNEVCIELVSNKGLDFYLSQWIRFNLYFFFTILLRWFTINGFLTRYANVSIFLGYSGVEKKIPRCFKWSSDDQLTKASSWRYLCADSCEFVTFSSIFAFNLWGDFISDNCA